MKLPRRLEDRLERLVDGVASRWFGGDIHPLELTERLLRSAEDALVDGPSGPTAPNRFEVLLGSGTARDADIGPAQDILTEAVETETHQRGWRLEGPVAVVLRGDEHTRGAEVQAHVAPGRINEWASLDGPEGKRHALRFNRSLIGRSGEADVHLASDTVSRRHALLWRQAGKTWLEDLGSANGTSINGTPVGVATEVLDGDTLGFGDVILTIELGGDSQPPRWPAGPTNMDSR